VVFYEAWQPDDDITIKNSTIEVNGSAYLVLIISYRRGGPMNIKPYLIILCSSFALVIIVAVVSNILESNGILSEEKIGPRGTTAIQAVFFVLFMVIAFTIVPPFVRLFIVMQLKIGNGEFVFVKWFVAHEQAVVYGFWSILVAGLCIIYFLDRDNFLKL
jgi:hypothetical protein